MHLVFIELRFVFKKTQAFDFLSLFSC